MNRFAKMMTLSGKYLQDKRTEILMKQSERAMKDELRQKEDLVDNLTIQISILEDMRPTNANSTAAARKDFVPGEWAKTLVKLSIDLEDANMQLKPVQALYDRWFVDEIERDEI
jgi:hypothetical protein